MDKIFVKKPKLHYPNPTLTLTFWLGVSYYAVSRLSRLSRLSTLYSRRWVIYSKTCITRLLLTLKLQTPKLNLNFNLSLKLNLNLTLYLYQNLNWGSAQYSTSEKL